MTIVHFARHGETVWHAENRYAGRSDIALTVRGLDQADRLAYWAARADLDRLIASDLSRALATAEPVGRSTGLTVEPDARFAEVDFGEGEGLTASEMEERFGARRQAFIERPASVPLPEGELGADAVARSTAALRDIVDRSPDAKVLIVAHTTLIRLTLCGLLGIPLDDYRRVFPTLDNVAVTTVRIEKDMSAGLLRYNVPAE